MSKGSIRILLGGNSQHGKSTLAKLLAPESRAVIGDGSEPTIQKTVEYISNCQTISVLDSPGINANTAHTEMAKCNGNHADIFILVSLTEKTLHENVIALCRHFSDQGVPLVIVLNCKGLSHEQVKFNDPKRDSPIHRETRAILASVDIEAKKIFTVNLAWAAASRGILSGHTDLLLKIKSDWERLFPSDPECRTMYGRSRFEELRQFALQPSPAVFDEDGLLTSALLGRIQRKIYSVGIHYGQ